MPPPIGSTPRIQTTRMTCVPVVTAPDLLPPTDEMQQKCLAVLPDLHSVARLLA